MDPNLSNFNENTDSPSMRRHRISGSRSMATAAMVLGLIAIPLFFVFYISIPLAATAIVLALLSRGDGSLHPRAKVSLIVSIAAIAASVLVTGYAFITVRNNPALRRELEQMLDYFSDYYGEGADEEYLVPDHFFDSREGGITI